MTHNNNKNKYMQKVVMIMNMINDDDPLFSIQ